MIIESRWIELNEEWERIIELLDDSRLESIKIPINDDFNIYQESNNFCIIRRKLIDESIITIMYSE